MDFPTGTALAGGADEHNKCKTLDLYVDRQTEDLHVDLMDVEVG